MLSRYGIATWLGAMHAGCGVFMGDPIRLFPDKSKDAGIPASDSCELDRALVSGNLPTTVGATGGQLVELATHEYSSDISWTSGRATRLHVKLSNVNVYSVDATRNPDYDRWSETPVCEDHVTIEAALDINTDDGALAEHVDLVKLVAYDDYEAYGSFAIEKGALLGTYPSTARAGQCFVRLKVRLLIARDGTHGTLGDELEQGVCDDGFDGVISEYASARWGKRWTNYGD